MSRSYEQPSWLAGAVAVESRHSDGDFREESPSEILPGDVCVIEPYEQRGSIGRLLVVTDTGDGWVEGMLAGADTELATEVDAILKGAEAGLGYDIAVHSRFLGPIWTTQVRRRVGAVRIELLDQLVTLAWDDEAPEVSLRRGHSLQPEDIDPRYPALATLSTELDALTVHCRRRRHEFSMPLIDPALGHLDVLQALLSEPEWDPRVRAAASSTGFRDLLLDSFTRLTKDQQRAAMPFVERALAGPSPTGRADTVGMAVGHRDPNVVLEAIAEIDQTQPVVTVLSHPRCWRGTAPSAIRVRRGGTEAVVVFTSVVRAGLGEVA